MYKGEDYRTLRHTEHNKMEWFSYDDKQQRPLIVVAKWIHAICNTKSLKEDLEGK